MQLGRYQVTTQRPPPILGINFSYDGRVFAVATETGYEVWRTWPVGLLRRRALPGTLARAVPIPQSPLLVLQGGGSNPLFPPNKAVVYHDIKGPVAELEFGERIRGIAVRHRTIVIVLLRRAFAYEYDTDIRKIGEWETAENENGLSALSTAPGSTLLALPGRQPGHVQLIHLPRGVESATPNTFRSPILLVHTHPLSSLACSATGSHLLTASERGTLLRVWDTSRGVLESELRRGVDRAEIWGVLFEDSIFPVDRRDGMRRKGGRVVGWSDKGTVHVWETTKPKQTPAILKAFSLPNYFSSTASYAQYYLPRKNPHAFSGAIGAATDAAGIPSMKIKEDVEHPEEREWAERYVVSWIEVEVEDVPERLPSVSTTGMGTREERRSFGSDSTRTATPSLRSQTPTNVSNSANTSSTSLNPTLNLRRSSSGGGSVRMQGTTPRRKVSTATTATATTPTSPKRRERQLVVITHAGDWYRLRLPQDDGEDGNHKSQCELVEYRRLGVGGSGW